MDKNNLLLVLIGLLFIVLFGSYMHKTEQLDFLDNRQERQEDWRQDQDWRNQQTPPSEWPQQPPEQQPHRDPFSYPDAVQLSQQTGKNMVLFFYADWCAHCTAMKASTMEDPDVKRALSNFVYYRVDTDKEGSVGKKYGVRSIPAYHIVNSQETSLKQGEGRVSSSEFIRWMKSNRT